jgi:predicted nucleotide-binding protein
VKLEKNYKNVRFDPQTFSEADLALGRKNDYRALTVKLGDCTWTYNTFAEFLATANQGTQTLYAISSNGKRNLIIFAREQSAGVEIEAPTRPEIESIISVFDKNAERCRPLPKEKDTKIFIGHGRNELWRDLKDHLQDIHNYDIEAYETGSRGGLAVQEILEQMLDKSSLALLVMTGEDETKDGKLRARQNVVHEIGLFQGGLGFRRAIILLENGTEEFSNIAGLQQIRFSKNNIKETFGEVLGVLTRELE